LKDREILYAPNHRINNLRGCYLCVKYKDEFDDEQISKKSTNLIELDKDLFDDEFDDTLISQTKLTKTFKSVIKLDKIKSDELNEILNDIQNGINLIELDKIKSDDEPDDIDDDIDTINNYSNSINFQKNN
jgi:hypothetical protein